MNAPNATPALPVISEQTEALVKEALETLHTVLGTYGSPLPEFSRMMADIGTNSGDRALDAGRITNRAIKALAQLSSHRREEKVRAFREGVEEIVSGKVADAKAAKATIDAMPAAQRAFLPAFPKEVWVAVSDVAPVFPTGTPETDMYKFLQQLGYKLGKQNKVMHIVADFASK
jgi:hypothetical protein